MEKMTFAKSLEEIKKLVESFKKEEKSLQGEKEANIRRSYIDPMFEALGWDVSDKEKKHINKKDVIVELSLEMKDSTKSVDYSFRSGGTNEFFVEAKQINIDLHSDKKPALQIRAYGYTANLPLNIVTDFQEFIIYDCRAPVTKTDTVETAMFKEFYYYDYPTQWKEIWNLFSKEAVENGSLEYFKESAPKGTLPVDKLFLKDIEEWREILAENIAKHNQGIKLKDLNYAVQKIIDRIIFIRISESRGIEPFETLKNTIDKEHIYDNIKKLFLNADNKYNSGLFHFSNEKDRTELQDSITPTLQIDNKVFKKIIEHLYYPSPYEFKYFPADVLGNIYEKFLGKSITFKGKNNKAKIIETKEKRKGQGIYYTPSYVVDYIVEHTIGEKTKGKTPKDVDALKVVDPACGSGSFLIVAYQYLLDWYLEYYLMNSPEKWAKGSNSKIFKIKDSYQLTLAERKRILKNSIYGVDLDHQAVEVTKLSLLLKVLEYEGEEVKQQNLFEEQVLPDLYENIKCGNSLIGTDFYTESLDLDASEEITEINPFDWDAEFKEIMRDGGFDCVIGNPPYFNIQTLGANSIIAKYIQAKYADIWMDKSDILFYFIAKGLMISKRYVSYIVSNAFLMGAKSGKLRNYILENSSIERMVNFEQYIVFDDADLTTGIFVLNKNNKKLRTKVINLKEKIYTKGTILEKIKDNKNYFDVNFSKNNLFVLVDARIQNIHQKIDSNKKKLRDLLKIGKGMETASNPTFSFKEYPAHLSSDFIKKRITNSNISRYHIAKEKEYLLYFEHIKDFKDLPKEIQEHLNSHKKELKNRATVRDEGRIWWRYSRPMHKEYYHLNKIWTSYRSTHNAFVYDDTKEYIGLTNTTVIFDTNESLNLKYVLGLLNSNLLNFRYRSIGKQTGSGSFEYFEAGVGELPMAEADKEIQDEIAKLVDKMIILQKHYHASTSIQEKPILEKQIHAIDKEIDKLVYQLYELTDEEIQIVEGN